MKRFEMLALIGVFLAAGCGKSATDAVAVPPAVAPIVTAGKPIPATLASAQTASARTTRPRTARSHPTAAAIAPKPADAGSNAKPLTLVLETKNYLITIVDDREEGVVSSDTMKYHCVSRKSGHRITLTGSTYHHISPDGTPGAFLGYIFQNGDTIYVVYEQGEVVVTRGDKTLVDEKGKWVGQNS